METRCFRAVLAILVVLTCASDAGHAQWLPRKGPNGPRLMFPGRDTLPIVPHRPPDSILVKFRPSTAVAGLHHVQALVRGGLLPPMVWNREISHIGVFVYKLPNPASLLFALNRLRAMPEVLYAEPGYRLILLS